MGLRPLAPQGTPPQLKYPSRFLSITLGCGTSQLASSPLLSVLMLLLLCILSYSTSVQLDFKQFSMMVVQFSCNFDVVWGSSEFKFTFATILTEILIKHFKLLILKQQTVRIITIIMLYGIHWISWLPFFCCLAETFINYSYNLNTSTAILFYNESLICISKYITYYRYIFITHYVTICKYIYLTVL